MRYVIFVFFVLGFFFCDSQEKLVGEEPIGAPKEYFPVHVGDEWEYEIELGEESPMGYKEVFWSLGEEEVCYATTEFFDGDLDKEKKYPLVLRVVEEAPEQGPLQWPNGFRLKVVEDSLGIFDPMKELYWCYAGGGNTGQRFIAQSVMIHSSYDSPVHGLWGKKDGFSINILFFADKPGIGLGIGRDPAEMLINLGVEESLLKFERKIENEQGELFKEYRYFKRFVGMVKLVQIVNGEVSMEWNIKY